MSHPRVSLITSRTIVALFEVNTEQGLVVRLQFSRKEVAPFLFGCISVIRFASASWGRVFSKTADVFAVRAMIYRRVITVSFHIDRRGVGRKGTSRETVCEADLASMPVHKRVMEA